MTHLLASEDEDVIIKLKYHYKNLAFRSDCDSSEYRMIYPELNNCFIEVVRSSNRSRAYKFSELLALRGHLKFGRRFIWHYENTLLPIYENTLYPIRSILKRV